MMIHFFTEAYVTDYYLARSSNFLRPRLVWQLLISGGLPRIATKLKMFQFFKAVSTN